MSNNYTAGAGKQLPFSYNYSSSSAAAAAAKASQPLKHQRRGSSNSNSWLENNNYENRQRTSSSSAAAAEEMSSSRGGHHHLDLMDASPSCLQNNHRDHEDDDHVIIRRAEDHEADTTSTVEREHMFDKVVTPSDVGKLNRLVIPKQHAEKYFPLDSSTNDKGLLLNFEDRNGKPWRFRYSYWNSSQSYVMTKGWSRFVKEKKLDAGDIVSFQRGLGELGKDRLFIDWRRRPEIPSPQGVGGGLLIPPLPHQQQQHYLSFQRMSNFTQLSSTTTPLFLQPNAPLRDYSHHYHPNASSYINQYPHYSSSTGPYGYGYGGGGSGGGPYGSYNSTSGSSHPSVICLRSTAAAAAHVGPKQQVQAAGMVQWQNSSGGGGTSMDDIGGAGMPVVFESVPVVQGKAAAKRLRLFGVNMDCPLSESDECGGGADGILSSSSSSTTSIMPNASSSSSTMASWPHPPPPNIHPLQLRLYNGSTTPLPTIHHNHKGNASNKSLDFDI